MLAALIACALPGAAGAQSECGLTPASWVFCAGFEEGNFNQ